ncbi:MAG: metallophosphoesterase family protein [Bacteroidota bacterium]
MKRIGILSDTHCYLHPKTFSFFSDCDQLWHAGDIGNLETANKLSDYKPMVGVYGNIDGQEIRASYPEHRVFSVEQKKILIIHIGGTPKKYDAHAKKLIEIEKPDIFVCGHSHICRVQYDTKNHLMYINPGAAGKFGFHLKIILLRFIIDGADLREMEILELNKHDLT